jgi:hypothetical protein
MVPYIIRMKTLGAILIVVGLLVSIMGYGMYENVMCHYCPAQIAGHALQCHCGGTLQQNLGHVMMYVGLVVAASGITVFMRWWRKKVIFN